MKILAFNFKMNFEYKDVKVYLENLKGKINDKNIIMFPPTIFLPYFISNEYSFGLQNISEFPSGAHTGEVSASQLKSLGGTYTLVGHSERRIYEGEIDSKINAKIKIALKNNLKVILCIGETLEDHSLLKTTKVLKKQLLGSLGGLAPEDLKNIIIAYEPVWSIGTGVVPENNEISAAIKFIIETCVKLFNYKPKVLYGGSVNEKNVQKLLEVQEVSGFLVGGASLDANKVLKIKEVVEK